MDSESPLRKKLHIYFIGVTAALAGLLFGLDVGAISGTLSFLNNDFKLSIGAEGAVVSALLWGAVIGTLISGMLSSQFGRRKTILISAVVFAIGAFLCSISPSELVLIGDAENDYDLLAACEIGVAAFGPAPRIISSAFFLWKAGLPQPSAVLDGHARREDFSQWIADRVPRSSPRVGRSQCGGAILPRASCGAARRTRKGDSGPV